MVRLPPISGPVALPGLIFRMRLVRSTSSFGLLAGVGEEACGLGGHDYFAEVVQGEWIVGQGADGAVEGDEACAFMDCVQERGDVAVTDEDFRFAFDKVVVEVGENSWRSPAAGVADHSVHAVIVEHAVDVAGAVAIVTGEVAPFVEGVRADDDFEADGFHLLFGELDLVGFEGGGGGEDQADGVAWAQSLWFDDGLRGCVDISCCGNCCCGG